MKKNKNKERKIEGDIVVALFSSAIIVMMYRKKEGRKEEKTLNLKQQQQKKKNFKFFAYKNVLLTSGHRVKWNLLRASFFLMHTN